MKIHYQPSNSPFAIKGVIAVSMSDEIRKQLEGKQEFLDEKSKEVQAYLAAQAEQATAQQDAQDLAEAKAQALEELTSKRVLELLKVKRDERSQSIQAQRKAGKGK